MNRYLKVEKPRADVPIKENEIRVTAQGLIRNYISYATTLLQEKHTKEIVLKAMGQAISKTVSITEIIKKKIPGLYQETSISSMSITDAYEPIEEGLKPLEMTRQVSLVTITLSTTELNKNSPGYQAPSDTEQSHAESQQPKQNFDPSRDFYQDSYGTGGRSRGRGRGRGQGRGWGQGRGRGRGRGDYGDYYQDDGGYGGYYNTGQGRHGRGRDWGNYATGYSSRGRVGGGEVPEAMVGDEEGLEAEEGAVGTRRNRDKMCKCPESYFSDSSV